MKKSLLTVTGIVALALAVPGAALAHNGHGRRHHHHNVKARAHHAKFHLVQIGSPAISPASSPAPTTPPATQENAGTVTSYTNGVLTLTLNDGSTVSGKVTNETRIRCIQVGTEGEPTDQGPGDDNGQGDDQGRGDMDQRGDQGAGNWQGDGNGTDGDDDENAPGASEPPCDSSALVTGAIVRFAELRISSGGTEFESIVLVR